METTTLLLCSTFGAFIFLWYFNLFNLFDFLTYNCKKAIVVEGMAAQKLVWPRKRQKLTQTKKSHHSLKIIIQYMSSKN